jgi:CheY-like chemotaxis protein
MGLVLIVDDLRFEREWAGHVAMREGHAVVEAANGSEALALIDQQHPDCVLTDLTMPEMDGLQLLDTLHARGDHVPVIVLTADRQPRTRAECERLGARAFLPKSWDADALERALRDALASPQ